MAPQRECRLYPRKREAEVPGIRVTFGFSDFEFVPQVESSSDFMGIIVRVNAQCRGDGKTRVSVLAI
jgi:hypothetical protein